MQSVREFALLAIFVVGAFASPQYEQEDHWDEQSRLVNPLHESTKDLQVGMHKQKLPKTATITKATTTMTPTTTMKLLSSVSGNHKKCSFAICPPGSPGFSKTCTPEIDHCVEDDPIHHCAFGTCASTCSFSACPVGTLGHNQRHLCEPDPADCNKNFCDIGRCKHTSSTMKLVEAGYHIAPQTLLANGIGSFQEAGKGFIKGLVSVTMPSVIPCIQQLQKLAKGGSFDTGKMQKFAQQTEESEAEKNTRGKGLIAKIQGWMKAVVQLKDMVQTIVKKMEDLVQSDLGKMAHTCAHAVNEIVHFPLQVVHAFTHLVGCVASGFTNFVSCALIEKNIAKSAPSAVKWSCMAVGAYRNGEMCSQEFGIGLGKIIGALLIGDSSISFFRAWGKAWKDLKAGYAALQLTQECPVYNQYFQTSYTDARGITAENFLEKVSDLKTRNKLSSSNCCVGPGLYDVENFKKKGEGKSSLQACHNCPKGNWRVSPMCPSMTACYDGRSSSTVGLDVQGTIDGYVLKVTSTVQKERDSGIASLKKLAPGFRGNTKNDKDVLDLIRQARDAQFTDEVEEVDSEIKKMPKVEEPKDPDCIPNSIFDRSSCEPLTTRTKCINEKNWAGVTQCTWRADLPVENKNCIENSVFDRTSCQPLTTKAKCLAEKNWAGGTQCTWAESNSCRPNTWFDRSTCQPLASKAKCIAETNWAGVTQCTWA